MYLAQQESPSIFALSQARPGDVVRVTGIGTSKMEKKRLLSMGVLFDSELHVLQRRGNNVVVGLDTSRIAIGSDMSNRIMVCVA